MEKDIGLHSTIIIAEAGVNHNGSMELAKRLIDVAADSGSDYIKFQTFKTELIISEEAKKADYQIRNSENSEESQFEMAKKLELSFDDFRELKKYCQEKKIGFLSTGFDFTSLAFLDEIGQTIFKIPSGEITNKPYLQYIGSFKKHVLMSTGMADQGEIKAALDVLTRSGLELSQITVLHCNTEYPTPMEHVNLLAMNTIRDVFGVQVGYSDHTLGIEVPIAAVTLGAKVIEKHFTLDRSLPGPDHKASLEPVELKAMVASIRNIEKALAGDGQKIPSESEIPNMNVARRSIHLKCTVKQGDLIAEEHLIMKRPGNGISPMLIGNVVGKRYKASIEANKMLTWDQIED